MSEATETRPAGIHMGAGDTGPRYELWAFGQRVATLDVEAVRSKPPHALAHEPTFTFNSWVDAMLLPAEAREVASYLLGHGGPSDVACWRWCLVHPQLRVVECVRGPRTVHLLPYHGPGHTSAGAFLFAAAIVRETRTVFYRLPNPNP